jgi:integrase
VKFPKRLKHRGKGKVLATIYRRSDGYRVYWRARVDGKPRSRMKDFASYSLAKREADKVVSELAKGIANPLSPGQASEALAAFERLQEFFRDTGRQVSLRAAVLDYCEAAGRLHGRTLREAVDGYLSTVVTVKREDLKAAVERFIASRESKTAAKDGKRPQLSPGYHYIVAMWLREFAGTFPSYSVSDLTKQHLDMYINAHGDVSARTRNGRRTVVKMFLKWAVQGDLLPGNHRLLSADAMAKEKEDFGEIELYAPAELRAFLDAANARAAFRPLLPVVALGGLAGLRLQEIARLTWQDVFRVSDHIEISAGKAKTRQRRLVEVCPSLSAWLQPFREFQGAVWGGTLDNFHDLFGELRGQIGIAAKRSGLRHAFCSYHFALHGNENLTAQQAGNSPAMLHQNYKGLATRKEAEAWFAVAPAPAASNILPLSQVAVARDTN